MCLLPDRLAASRAGLTGSAVPSFGRALRRRYGGQRLCEHVLSDKPTGGIASRTDRFCCSIIRVLPPAGVDIGGRLLYNIDVFLSVLSETGTGQSPSANGKKQLRRFQINKEVRRQHEKNVSAQKAAEKQSAWLPQTHGKQEWQKCLKTPPRQGEKKTDCLVLSRAATLCYSLFSHG